ncbi:hypothetical protein ACJD0Z_11370 [Flavobacteriaceae bacterium M23B6Z8]
MSHIQDMNNRIRQNKEQRPSNRARFKENNRDGIYANETKAEEISFKIVPDEVLIEIKQRIRTQAQSKRKKELVILIIFGSIGFIFLIGILVWIN